MSTRDFGRDDLAHRVTLRELLGLVGEQGLLVFCAILAMPFLLPVTLPFMSTALGLPMLLIGVAVVLNRVPWLPDRLLDHALPAVDVILLCLGMAERDGLVILLGYVVSLLSTAYVGTLLWLAARAGSDPAAAWDAFTALIGRLACA